MSEAFQGEEGVWTDLAKLIVVFGVSVHHQFPRGMPAFFLYSVVAISFIL